MQVPNDERSRQELSLEVATDDRSKQEELSIGGISESVERSRKRSKKDTSKDNTESGDKCWVYG